ncbi:MAG TPA: patatin-like phospholipase family protein [Povalibacter sp.]
MTIQSLLRAVVITAVATLSLASVCAVAAAESGRPRIGLVLSGGGAKGGAHVGVLKMLEEQHVPIDCIAGTSMGALVGGGYASGMPAAELEKFLVGIDWQKVVGSQGRRQLEPIEQKRAGATYSNDLEFGVSSRGVSAPGGLVNTSNIEDLLRVYVATARMETDFNKLPIPFRAVATDMVSGKMIVLDQGDLATAMRASMAIPGAFSPVLVDQMILSDGGLVRNIPIDVARKLCADVVIVVNLVEPAADPAKIRSVTQLLSRSMDVMIEANETLQLQTLQPGDVLINIEMGSIGTSDFELVPETIPLGEAATRAASTALARYAVSEQEYMAWRTSVTSSQQIEATLADVRFEGLKRVNPEHLAAIDTVQAGDKVDAQKISMQAQRMAALQDFDSVGYRLDGDPQTPTLTWLPREKSWGPDYLKVDLGAYASVGGDIAFTLYGRHLRTWVNSLGAEWRNEVQIGDEALFNTSFFQPLDQAHRFFVEPRAFYSISVEDVFRDNERVARYNFEDTAGVVDLGLNMGRFAQLRLGYIFDRRRTDVDIGPEVLPQGKSDDAGVQVAAQYDSRDTAFNPTRGIALALEYMRSDDALGADRNWERAEIGFGVVVPFRRDVLWVRVAGGSDLRGNLPADRAFALGGPGGFPGFELGELRVNGYWTIGTNYLWKVKDVMPVRNLALYAGVGLAGGAVYDRINDEGSDSIYSGSVFLTGRTLVGPLTVGIAATSLDSWSMWLSVGRPVGHGTILERGIFR